MNSDGSISARKGSLCTLVLFLVAAVGTSGQSTNSTQSTPTNTQLDRTVAEVEADLSTNNPSSTSRLIATLEGLESQSLYYMDNLAVPTKEERLKGPPMLEDFVKITNELANRGGESVWQGFEQMLIGNKLQADEKKILRDSFHAKTGRDMPFTLPANDRTQTREYCLLLDPKNCQSWTVHKGDMLVQISRKAYPKLSQWSGADILAFINDLESQDSIRAGQTLKIYEYKILKDEATQ